MKELKGAEYGLLEAFFNQKKQHVPALSVLQGNYPGRVFADQLEGTELAVVWATGRWMYAAGNIGSEQCREALKVFLQEVVIPDCTARNLKWFEIYADDTQGWDMLFLGGLDGLNADKHFESVYELQLEQFSKILDRNRAIANHLVVRIEESPVVPEAYLHLPYVHHKFQELTAAGAAVKLGERLLTVCRNNGFTAGNRYFIDVDTYEFAERGKGYGALAATALIGYYLQRGRVPLWETTHENLPSHRLATKLGFIPVEHYPGFTPFC